MKNHTFIKFQTVLFVNGCKRNSHVEMINIIGPSYEPCGTPMSWWWIISSLVTNLVCCGPLFFPAKILDLVALAWPLSCQFLLTYFFIIFKKIESCHGWLSYEYNIYVENMLFNYESSLMNHLNLQCSLFRVSAIATIKQ